MVIGAPQGGPKEAPSRAIAPQRCDTLACHLVAAPPAKGGLRLVVQRRRPTSLASNVKSEIIAVNIGDIRASAAAPYIVTNAVESEAGLRS